MDVPVSPFYFRKMILHAPSVKGIIRKKDKIGRNLCYDDTTGKRVSCGGSPGTAASKKPTDNKPNANKTPDKKPTDKKPVDKPAPPKVDKKPKPAPKPKPEPKPKKEKPTFNDAIQHIEKIKKEGITTESMATVEQILNSMTVVNLKKVVNNLIASKKGKIKAEIIANIKNRIESLFKDSVDNSPEPVKTTEDSSVGNVTKFPTSLDNLKVVQKLGGSTGAELVEDDYGNKYVRKRGFNSGHINEEFTADSIYRSVGINVPDGKMYDSGVKLSTYLDNAVSLNQYLAKASESEKQDVIKQIQDGFVMDALLGNWDVIGLSKDNIMIKDGKPYRIDNGGSLRYRAQGGAKPSNAWTEEVSELKTMRNKFTNPSAESVFGALTDDQIKQQIKDVVANKNKILEAASDAVRPMLSKRIAYLEEMLTTSTADIKGSVYFGAGKDWPSAPPKSGVVFTPLASEAGKKVFKNYGDNDTRSYLGTNDIPSSYTNFASDIITKLPQHSITALKNYTANGYSSLNDNMRRCPETLDCLTPEQKNKVTSIDNAISSFGVLKKPMTVWRGVSLVGDKMNKFMEAMKQALNTGDEIRMPGYKSTSLSPTASFSEGLAVALEIKAKTGAYVESITSTTGEQEILQGHNTRYRVVGIKTVPWGSGYNKKTIVQLEEICDS